MNSPDRVAGVLGGMGPEATIDFVARVISHTPANKDQDHVRMLIDHNTRVPSRSDGVFDASVGVGRVLASMAARLEAMGADFLVMPCNTAHAFQEDIRDAASIPLVSIVDETVSTIRKMSPVPGAVGILATNGCLHAKLYQTALEQSGLSAIVPTATELVELMELINFIKAGCRTADVKERLRRLGTALLERGADVVVAACTEIPLVLDEETLGAPLVSSTDVLAKKTVMLARGNDLRPDKLQ